MSPALKQAEEIVDSLSVQERMRLLQSIAPRLSEGVESEPAAKPDVGDSAWQAFREVGRRIAKLPTDGISATQMVSDMRR